MATKLYFHLIGTSVSGTLPASTATISATTPAQTIAQGNHAMNRSIGTLQATASITTNGTANAQPTPLARFISDRLAAQTFALTSAGDISLSIGGSESNAGSNFQVRISLATWRPSTGAVVTRIHDLAANSTLEPGTSETSLTSTNAAGGTSATIADGDVLICEIWRDSTVPGAATARTNTVYFDGTTEGSTTSNAAFINFPNDTLIFAPQVWGQAQAQIKTTARSYGQAQAFIAYGTIRDTFTRSVSNGLGTADTGGPYSTVASGWDVDGSKALIGTSGDFTINLIQSSISNIAVTYKADFSLNSTGYFVLGPVPGNPGWGIQIQYLSSLLILYGQIDGSGSGPDYSGYVFNDVWRVEAQFAKSSDGAQFRGRLYKIGTTPPEWYRAAISNPTGTSKLFISTTQTASITLDNLEITDNRWSESGQAQAFIFQPIVKQFAQAQAFISKSAGYGQANALINGTFTTIVDTFTRSVTDGLGSADTGGAWTIISGNVANFDVNGTQATITSSAGNGFSAQLGSALIPKNYEAIATFNFSQLPVSAFYGFILSSLLGSTRNPSDSGSLGEFDVNIGGSIFITTYINGAGTSTTLGTYVAGEFWNIKVRNLSSSSENTTYLKVWKVGDAEPAWNLVTSRPIDTGGFLAAGHSGIYVQIESGTTFTLDNFNVYQAYPVAHGQAQAFITSGKFGYGQAQAKVGPTILLVVADKTSLTTMDANLKDRLITTLNYAVQVASDEDAVPSLTGISAIVIAESVLNATLSTKYRNVAAPIMLLDSGPAINMDMASAIGSVPSDSMEVVDGSHIAAAGKSGIVTVFSSSDTIRWITTNANAKVYLVQNVNPSGVTYDAGVTMFNAHVSEGRRLFLGSFFDNTAALTNSNDWDFFDAGIAYLVRPTTLNNIFSQAQASIKATGRGYGQAQADIEQTYNSFAQAQADVKQAYRGFGQTQADIKATYNTFAQSQADIKQTYNAFAQAQAKIQVSLTTNNSYGQAQADIKQTYNVFAQAQADIKQTYNSFAQSQADIKQTYNAFGQANADIKQTYQVYAQSQADIKQTYNGFGQANADIKATSNAFAQAQADIKATINRFAQAQADIKTTYNAFAQANADIKSVSRSYAQAQADIKVTTNQFAQAQAWIETTTNQFAQANADIKATSNAFAQAQAKMNAFGVQAYAQALSNIKGIDVEGVGQAQAKINAFGVKGYGQAQADIKATYNGYGQAQAQITNTYKAYAQAQADIKVTTNQFAQAQANIKQTYKVFAQAQADIKTTYAVYGQAQADIEQTYNGFGQSNADIKVVSNGYGQAQGDIKQIYQSYAQSQADIKQTYNGYGQSQADIKSIYQIYAQAQADIKVISNVYSQAQADIKTTYQGYAQANADILATSNSYGQAQGDIKQTYNSFAQAQGYILVTNVEGFGQAQADIKQTYQGYAQAQADIKQVYQGYGQAQADIEQTYNGYGQAQACIRGNAFGQANADIKATSNSFAQAQAKINAFAVKAYGQAQGNILGAKQGYGQAQADIKAISRGYGQGQAFINKSKGLGQAQADIKAVSRGYGQSQADIKAIGRGYGQANADILKTINGFAQAQADIEQTYNVFAQAQANIKAISRGYGQANSDIKATSRGYGQACADILKTTNSFAQAQADISATSTRYGQSQADIKSISNGYGQSQSDIKQIYNGFGQAQGTIEQTYNGFGQAQAQILLNRFAFGQAQAHIKLIRFGVGQSQADILVTTRVYANAQGYISTNVIKVAQAQAQIKISTSAYAQAQAYIISGRAVFGQAQALIFITANGYGQAQATIIKSTVFGQAQAYINQPHTLANVTVSDEHATIVTLSDTESTTTLADENTTISVIIDISGPVVTVDDEELFTIILEDVAFL